MEGAKAMIEDFELPVLAMNGRTPCAAAFYSDARMNRQNRFWLSDLIRNAGDDCRGGGAAILCYLIRHSENKGGDFNPLVLAPFDSPKLKLYYESFGCTSSDG